MFVKDVKNESLNALYKSYNEQISLHVHGLVNGSQTKESTDEVRQKSSIPTGPNIDMKIAQKLSAEVKRKLDELDEKGIDINHLLLEMLQKREEKIAEEKEKLSVEAQPTKSRYIKVKVRKVIQKEHGTICSIPGCNKPARALHHTRRFALSRTHDPYYLSPMCHGHHEISHSIDRKVQAARSDRLLH